MRKSGLTLLFFSLLLLTDPSTLAQQDQPVALKDSSIQHEVITLKAEDGGTSWGILYTPENALPQTAILDMHPRGDRGRNRLLPALAKVGFAAFGHNNRYLANDTDGIHEHMLLDIAAGVRFLRSRGFQRVVLMGVSGGGSLMAFYQAQATTEPPARVSSTPAGDPPDLNAFDLPAADGLLMVIPHLGEGKILETRIDPSVINEGDPFSIDPALDMYNPTNGFRMPPHKTNYSKEFIARYQAAQGRRMEGLEAWARELVAEQNHYRGLMNPPEFESLPSEQQQWITRRAGTTRMMTLYRTWADLRYMDLTLDPSDRVVGDNSGTTPWIANDARPPTPAYNSPRAFLSSRSNVSSNAVTVENMARVTVPTLIVQGTAHRAIYPNETRAIFEASGAQDKKLVWIEGGDVSFRPSGPKAGKGDQRQQSLDAVLSWMLERFPH
jgi:pimeloyl-ACP methyl ester carboxylesterase